MNKKTLLTFLISILSIAIMNADNGLNPTVLVEVNGIIQGPTATTSENTLE